MTLVMVSRAALEARKIVMVWKCYDQGQTLRSRDYMWCMGYIMDEFLV